MNVIIQMMGGNKGKIKSDPIYD